MPKSAAALKSTLAILREWHIFRYASITYAHGPEIGLLRIATYGLPVRR